MTELSCPACGADGNIRESRAVIEHQDLAVGGGYAGEIYTTTEEDAYIECGDCGETWEDFDHFMQAVQDLKD